MQYNVVWLFIFYKKSAGVLHLWRNKHIVPMISEQDTISTRNFGIFCYLSVLKAKAPKIA
ncbi:MAG: hypothetical protein EA343_25100 [Nodularia sp. (in: Bacteria)]|nr:MAG: hypothetical protein EA343_25100 [Nodularia sp. (in: cyanobacteria)]